MKKLTLLLLAVLLLGTMNAMATNIPLNEAFNSTPSLSSDDADGTWYTDRYAPAAFEKATLSGQSVLKIGINGSDGAQLRPSAYSSAFYNTQGRKFNQQGLNVTSVKASLYIPADWAGKHRRSDLWGTAFDANNEISFYPIIGFGNTEGNNPTLRYWNDVAGWVNIASTITYNSWYTFEYVIDPIANTITYKVNNAVVGTVAAGGSKYVGNVIMQAYNFNDITLAAAYDASSENSYNAYWDNLIATRTIEVNLKNQQGELLAGGSLIAYTSTGSFYVSQPTPGVFKYTTSSPTISYRMHYNTGTENRVDLGSNPEFTAYDYSVNLKNSADADLTGGTVIVYGNNGSAWVSDVNSTTAGLQTRLLPGDFKFRMHYNTGTETCPAQTVGAENDNFYTFTAHTYTVNLLNSADAQLAGGTVILYGDNGSTWINDNDVATPGLQTYIISGDAGDTYKFRMHYNTGTETCTAQAVDATNNSYTFTAHTYSINLKDCQTSAILASGTVIIYGDNGSTWISDKDATTPGLQTNILSGDDGDTYKFRMHYNWAFETSEPVEVNAVDNFYDFRARKVTLNDPNGIIIYGNNGSGWFSKPSMNMLAGSYRMKIGTTTLPLIVDGCSGGQAVESCDGFPYKIYFVNSTNEVIPNAPVTWYNNGWKALGTTDQDGMIEECLNPYRKNVSFNLSYEGRSQQIDQDFSKSNIIIFRTYPVAIDLKNSDNGSFTDAYSFQYYGNGWKNYAPETGKSYMEMLPGKYSLSVSHRGRGVQVDNIEVGLGKANGFIFKTQKLYLDLKVKDDICEDAGQAPGTFAFQYYGNGWKSYVEDGQGFMELLPGKYSLSVSYRGRGVQEDNVVIVKESAQIFNFYASRVAMNLFDSDGAVLTPASFAYYGNGWKSYTEDGEEGCMYLLPGKYSFSASYNGMGQQIDNIVINKNYGGGENVCCDNQSVTFRTRKLNIPGATNFYANGWKAYTAPFQFLPGNYTFKINNVQSQIFVPSYGTVLNENICGGFNAIAVEGSRKWAMINFITSDGKPIAGAEIRFRYNNWSSSYKLGTTNAQGQCIYDIDEANKLYDLTNNLVSVPANAANFNQNDLRIICVYKNASYEIAQNLITNNWFTFQTKKVTAKLFDEANITELPATWRYRYNNWSSAYAMNNAGEELLPVTIRVFCDYKNASVEKEQATATHFTFQTKKVTAKLFDEANETELTATWRYRYNNWSSAYTMNNAGEELLPVTIRVFCDYKHASVEKEQATDTYFKFNTKKVTAKLFDEANTMELTATWQYRYNNWSSAYAMNNAGEELLPVTIRVFCIYKNANVEKEQATDTYFKFNTKKVTAKLLDAEQNELTATWKYRYNNWSSAYAMNNAGEELLPVTIRVISYYSGKTLEKEQATDTYFKFIWDGIRLAKQNMLDFSSSSIIYPNPSVGIFNFNVSVENDAPVVITIFDMSGRLVFEKAFKGSVNEVIDISNVQQGAYIVNINNNGEVRTERLIIQK